jgi:hypothetical protein
MTQAATVNRDLALKWIEALRSDKYTPTIGVLKSETGNCCLGVLCDIIGPDQWVNETVPLVYGALKEARYTWRKEAHSYLPKTVLFQIGISAMDGTFQVEKLPPELQARVPSRTSCGNYRYNTFVGINDDMIRDGKNPFPLIADIIEYALDHPEIKLFVKEDKYGTGGN